MSAENHPIPPKRTESLSSEEVQRGNADWWSSHPMTYDWKGKRKIEPLSLEWFDAMDEVFISAARLFATDQRPFDRIMPLADLAGKRVLEIGCGMGLHTETLVRAGAKVTAIDLTPTAVEATRRRLALKGLSADVMQVDAERLPFPDKSFDFVWSWGVIHHSANTGRIVRQIARVLSPGGSCRVMVYNRSGTSARIIFVREHLLRGGFLRRSFEETLYHGSDGFSARFYVREQFEDLFRTFFEEVSSEICGQDADALPIPGPLRKRLLRVLPDEYLRRAQARRGSFIFLQASRPR